MVRLDRLEKLATFVEMGGPPGHRFDMSFWGNAALRAKAHCGTAGCMMGLATLLWPEVVTMKHPGTVFVVEGAPITGCLAAAHLFGITYDEALELFNWGPGTNFGWQHMNDHKYHAARLRDFISRKRVELGEQP